MRWCRRETTGNEDHGLTVCPLRLEVHSGYFQSHDYPSSYQFLWLSSESPLLVFNDVFSSSISLHVSYWFIGFILHYCIDELRNVRLFGQQLP